MRLEDERELATRLEAVSRERERERGERGRRERERDCVKLGCVCMWDLLLLFFVVVVVVVGYCLSRCRVNERQLFFPFGGVQFTASSCSMPSS